MAFVVVKLKAFKVFRTDSASMEWPLLGGFRVLTPLIWSKFAKILTRDSTLASKNILKYWGFYGKGTDPKFALLIRGFLLTMAEIEKYVIVKITFSHWAIQICQNQGSISCPLSGKDTVTFCTIGAIFGKKIS